MVLIKTSQFPFHLISIPGIVMVTAIPGFAAVYLNVEQAQQVMFPGEMFTVISLDLQDDMRKMIEEKLGVSFQSLKQKIWQAQHGGYFFVDQVIGKHELITYAVGINPDGAIRQVEIMEYRESYGGEIRQKRWRRQFEGKTADAPLELNNDIKNISGATLSSRHITEGVKRILGLYEIAFRK